MINGIEHISFTVLDVDRAVRFWTDAVGLKAAEVVERDGDWPARVTGIPGARLKIAHMFGYGHHVEFIEYLEGKGDDLAYQPNMAGVPHIALDVQDIHSTCETLLEQGATRQGEIFEVIKDSIVSGWAIYIRDPNGILIQLWESKQNETEGKDQS